VATKDDLQLPLTVDSFAITRPLGAGAMGLVYLANDVLTKRAVAVKVMSRQLLGNKRAEDRFRREIAAMGQLRHAGIPFFAGYGDMPDGRPYLAMEFVNGHPLDAFVTEGKPLPEDLALWVAIRLADVIGFCNRESGMIHRDLKPSNVMVDLVDLPGLCEQSQIRVIDFGLASYIDFRDWDDFSLDTYQRAGAGTMAGEVMGTPAYMSPEQIRGEELTFQSDMYAMGSILFFLLTGRAPYVGSSAGVVMAAHLDSPVPDPSRLADVRPATVAVVQRAMAKSPGARFRSYQQFIANLQAARYASGQATKRVTRGYSAPQTDARQQPSTSGTETAHEVPASATWKKPDQPAQPPPPGSSGSAGWSRPVAEPITTSSWKRPVKTPPPAGQPITTSSWRRPVETPLPNQAPPSAALEPAATMSSSWIHRAVAIPPVPVQPMVDPSTNDEFPTTPAQVPLQVTKDVPSSSRWRRPVRTPPPADPASP